MVDGSWRDRFLNLFLMFSRESPLTLNVPFEPLKIRWPGNKRGRDRLTSPVSVTMQLHSLLLVALLAAVSGQHPGTMLHKQNLPGEKSLCNDGTRATYYTQEGLASGSVLIGLQVLFLWDV